jgi:hypothetical protein
MSGLWRNNPKTPEGKYLVTRRDGTIPEWPWFVLGANDPAAVYAIRAYADYCNFLEMDPSYVSDLRIMAEEWARRDPKGKPDAPPAIIDDPATIEMMKRGHSA